jgi:hypothetical protein
MKQSDIDVDVFRSREEKRRETYVSRGVERGRAGPNNPNGCRKAVHPRKKEMRSTRE